MGDFANTFRNAYVGAFNPKARAMEQEQEEMTAASDIYKNYYADALARGVDRNSPEFFQGLTQAANTSGNKYMMQQLGLAYEQDQQRYAFNPAKDPNMTDDLYEIKAMGVDMSDPIAVKNAYMEIKTRTARAGATNIHMSPTMQMGDPNWANMPMDEKIATKVQWKDSANNGKWPTNGDYQSGALEMIGPINDENRTKGNAYLVYGTEGERTINPLYQKGGILSDKTRKGVAEGNWILDSSVRQAMKDQAVIDFAPDSLKKSLLSDQGKALNMGGDLVVEPNLRLMTGSAAGGTEHPRIKNMIAPNVYDSPQQAITKRAIVKMMNTYYKGMAAGFHVDPYAADDMLLGEVGEGSKKMALGYNHATGKIYYALPNGTKAFFTPEETAAFLEK